MIVIAKKGTTKLVKGARYEVRSLFNSTNRSRTNRVYLKGIGGYVVDNFTTTDGQPLPKIDWQEAAVVPEKRIEFEDLKVNDIIVCKSDRYSTLIQGAKYRIVDLKSTTTQAPGKKYIRTAKKVKFEGCNRYFDYSHYRFRKLTIDESRELQLSSVLDDEVNSCSVDVNIRKIDAIDNKNATLIKVLAKSIIDVYRHELDVVDWGCQKSGSKLKITRDDYKKLLKMSLKDILNIIETSN